MVFNGYVIVKRDSQGNSNFNQNTSNIYQVDQSANSLGQDLYNIQVDTQQYREQINGHFEIVTNNHEYCKHHSAGAYRIFYKAEPYQNRRLKLVFFGYGTHIGNENDQYQILGWYQRGAHIAYVEGARRMRRR
jgi:hypothetical protein